MAGPVTTSDLTGRELDEFIDAGLALLALPRVPAWKPGIRDHLQAMLAQAALVDGFALSDEAEPAALYEL